MTPSKIELKHELRQISSFQGLRASRFFLIFSSILVTLYCILNRYGIFSSYLLFINLLAPFFLALIPTDKNRDNFYLISLCKEYDFQSIDYFAHLITFWASNLLLLIWTGKTIISAPVAPLSDIMPFLLLICNILCYLFVYYYYQFRLHYRLSNNVF